MTRSLLFLLLLAVLISLSSAGAPTFCKCTCFKNSTIIPLGPEKIHDLRDLSSSITDPVVNLAGRSGALPDDPQPALDGRTASSSCTECTRAFCLRQGIDICDGAKEGDVMTLCFKRDSNKDKIIVWAFMIGTLGLLGWAVFKQVVAWRKDRLTAQQATQYGPVSGAGR